MTFTGGCMLFPVVYCDGKSENYFGDVMVFPTTNLKKTLPILSDKIGIAQHRLSVFITEKNSCRRIPFTGYVTLASVMSLEGAYYFYVKRCIKDSPVKNKNSSERSVMYQPRHAKPSIMMEILRMNREAFLMSKGYTVDSLKRRMAVGNSGGCRVAECKECVMAHMLRTVADFHLCAHDEVVAGFRTSAGQISRPVRNAGENGN